MKDETAAEILERHPEVKGCVLEWLWPFWAIYEDRGVIMEAEGTTFDEEYCCVGTREDTIRYLRSYDCWDAVIYNDEIVTENCSKEGILTIRYEDDCFDNSYLAEELPKAREIADMKVRCLRTEDMPETARERLFIRTWNRRRSRRGLRRTVCFSN